MRLGCRREGEKPAKGRLLALRIYNRELSARERRANAVLDRRRFELDCRRVPVVLTAGGDGLVSLDGSDFAAVVSNDCVIGEEVAVAVQDGAETEFLMWKPETGVDSEFVRSTRSGSLLVDRDNLRLTALFNNRENGGDKRIAGYSMNGLISMWDGISNVGETNAHDNASTVWKDLVGGKDMTINTANATVISNALDCLGTGNAAAAASAQTGYNTIEIVMDPIPNAAEQMVFCGGVRTRIIASSPSSPYMLEGSALSSLYYTGHSPATFAFTYSGDNVTAFYEDGGEKTQTTGGSGWNVVPGVVNIGSRNGSYIYRGRIYAIRLYNRVLSAEEIAENAELDGVRFFGRTTAEPSVVAARGSGTVRVNGGVPAASQEINEPYGTEVALTAIPEPGWDFVAWVSKDIVIVGSDIVSTNLTITSAPSLKLLEAVFVPHENRADRHVTDYSYDGLIGMWDGICNAGYGLAHDSTTNVWKDLAGSKDLPVVAGNGEFTENALRCLDRASGAAAGPVDRLTGIVSYEVVCERIESTSIMVNFGSGPWVACYSSGIQHHNQGFIQQLTTNVATLAFVNEPTYGWTTYENGARVLKHNGSDNWIRSSNQMALGCSPEYTGSYLYKGRIFAIRAYNRVLTPIEVARNSDLDQRRFFDCEDVKADRGIRRRGDGEIECRVRVESEGPGAVSVDGVTVTRGDFWVLKGTTVTLNAKPDAICTFLGWVDDYRRSLATAQYETPSIEVTVNDQTEIGAAFVRDRILRRAATADYARTGLTAMWDGIENAGPGLAHDPATNRWIDLSGNGRHWALDVETHCSWSDQGLVLAGTGLVGSLVAGATIPSGGAKTMEFVYANHEAKDGVIFSAGTDKVCAYTDQGWRVGFRSVGNVGSTVGYAAAAGSTNAYSAVNETCGFDWFAVNGTPRANDKMLDFWSKIADSTALGTGDGIRAAGELMCLRFYNRRLTGYERLLNARLDAIRYLGAPVPRIPGSCLRIK